MFTDVPAVIAIGRVDRFHDQRRDHPPLSAICCTAYWLWVSATDGGGATGTKALLPVAVGTRVSAARLVVARRVGHGTANAGSTVGVGHLVPVPEARSSRAMRVG